jgi:DNA-binding NtrC family response regulator
MRLTSAGQQGGGAAGPEFEFILRNLVDLRLQVEELRRRLDDGPQRVQVIDLGEQTGIADVTTEVDHNGEHPVLYRSGMTMADVEKATIEAALREYRGNRRRASEVLGIGERTLYRKIKAYHLE